MPNFIRMTDLDLKGKRVLIREDLNVPIALDAAGVPHINASQRLEAALPTLRLALEKGAAVMVMSHLGRPKEGVFEALASLSPVADWLSQHLGFKVALIRDYLDGVVVAPGALVLFWIVS